VFSDLFPLLNHRAIPPQFVENISLAFSSFYGVAEFLNDNADNPALCFRRSMRLDLGKLPQHPAQLFPVDLPPFQPVDLSVKHTDAGIEFTCLFLQSVYLSFQL
jgi:hypothetical protein